MSKYRIYPSLLDKFQALIDVDILVDEPWNILNDEYKETADEMSDRLEKELIDSINRVPKEPIEAADKGTCFNEVVDCLIAHRKCAYEGMDIQSGELGLNRVITAKLNGFQFYYDLDLCKAVAEDMKGAISQHYCEAVLATKYGDVELYGYADEIVSDVVLDIKTTGRYDFGKYGKGWQRHLYPYCLVDSGEVKAVSAFIYYVVVWKGGTKTSPVLTGAIYPEVYTYNHVQSKVALREMCERFIEWLEAHRDQITDLKVFGLNSKRDLAAEQAYDSRKDWRE